jgi:predicted amidohydrolase YtcJ
LENFFINGSIFTSNPDQPYVNSMIVKDGKIIWIGEEKDVEKKDRQIIDLEGRRVLPGFIDAHMHPLLLAEADQQIYAGPPNIHSIQQLLQTIQQKYEIIKRRNQMEWIQCWGYDESKLEEKRELTRWELDQVAPDVPVVVIRACAHVIVVNSAALEIAGIDRNTESPLGGQIDLRSNGELTGILRERARFLVYDQMPNPTLTKKAQLLTALSSKLFSQGITSITDLMAEACPIDFFDMYETAIKMGYKQRTVLYYLWEELKYLSDLSPQKLDSSQQLHVGGVKLFADGSVSGKTAWVESPYLGEENNYGVPVNSAKDLLQAADFAKKHQIQLVVHAMGEKAIKLIVDTFYNKPKWIEDAPSIRIEHAAIPTSETLRNAIETGIGFVTQPIFLFAEIESYLNNIGTERTENSYPFKTMLELGASFAFSSDAPATSWPDPSNPFIGIKAAVTRKAYNGIPFNSNQKIDIEDAILLYTLHAQKITRIPKVGQLKPGFFADFMVLDRDIFKINPEEIDEIKVLETYFNGERVYSAKKIGRE